MGKNEFSADQRENIWTLKDTSPERTCAVMARLGAFGITNRHDGTTVLAVLDNHGLFHEVITPRKGDTDKEILRRAKRTAKELGRRIANIRNGKNLPANSKEAELAKRWPQIGAHQMHLEELQVSSETFQRNRGGRIIPRYGRQTSRNVSPRGPRSEPEITHALQILDRYLEEECALRFNHRIECLGDILRSAMNLQYPREEVSEQVRWRLRDAKNKTPLHNLDYYEAIGVTYKINNDRQEIFLKGMSILTSPQTSAEEKFLAEDTLEKQFSFK